MKGKLPLIISLAILLFVILHSNLEYQNLRQKSSQWSNRFFGSGKACESACKSRGYHVCGSIQRECCQSKSDCKVIGGLLPDFGLGFSLGIGVKRCTKTVDVSVNYTSIFFWETPALLYCSQSETRNISTEGSVSRNSHYFSQSSIGHQNNHGFLPLENLGNAGPHIASGVSLGSGQSQGSANSQGVSSPNQGSFPALANLTNNGSNNNVNSGNSQYSIPIYVYTHSYDQVHINFKANDKPPV